MKNRLIILVMLLSLFLVACQSETREYKSTDVIFTGGNDIWSAELHMVNNQENKFVLKYKEEYLIDTEKFEFKLNAPYWAWGGMGRISTDAEGIYIREDIDADKIFTSKSDIIKVEIKWNDKVDNFTIKNE